MVLIPQVVDACKGKLSPLTGKQVLVVAAGGIYDGRGVAAALSLGASGVWVGTRFVASLESKAPPRHVNAVVKAGSDDTIRTTIYTGRPMRVLRNEQNSEWETYRKPEMLQLQAEGIVPFVHDQEKKGKFDAASMPLLMGQAIGGIHDVLPAGEIVKRMMDEAVAAMKRSTSFCKLVFKMASSRTHKNPAGTLNRTPAHPP
jgi:NAD(P)H-dependent flavin oxidoreductase YrpB (nitropropane dioxygenase family)